MYGEFDNIKICGIASAAPKRVVDNEIIAEKLGCLLYTSKCSKTWYKQKRSSIDQSNF